MVPIASVRSHLRPTGTVTVGLIGTLLVVLREDLVTSITALVITLFAMGVSLTTVVQMTVFSDHLDLKIGAFGIITRQLSRDDVILDAVDSLFIRTLTIETISGALLGPISRVRIWDRWPEAALRESGYRFRT